jgi:hypothetical protein
MKKRIIVTETQLNDYIERKKAKNVFNSILEEMYKNSKLLNNKISLDNANQTIIENYKRKKLINSHVQNLLKENRIIDDNGRII